jgi:iron(III) transport system ATP-binding protein
MAAELVLKDLTKTFVGKGEKVIAVDNMNLEVSKGELVTLLGPSGCGKTTTLRMIGGFELPTMGEISMEGKSITYLPPQRRDTATVFQSYGLFPHMSIFENVAFGLKVRKVSRTEIQRRVMETLSLVGLTGLEKRSPGNLSGGQQQRVALARALVLEPKVLLFDEPLSNLDAKLRIETREHIRRIQRSLHITSIYVTHDQAEAMAISDQIAVMNGGQLQQIGPPYEIYAHPANRFVADFIGRASFLKAQVVGAGEGQLTVQLIENVKLDIPAIPGVKPGDHVVAVVRPEAVDLVPEGQGDATATVVFAHYTGSVATYKILLRGEETIQVEVMNPQEKGFLAEGTRIGVRFHRQSVHLLKE